jgi:Uma2 family endonuclease
MSVSEETYRQVALEDPEGHWELYCGHLRQKPGMSIDHNWIMNELGFSLRLQLDRERFDVRVNSGHLRISAQNYFIPDVYVIPTELQQDLWGTRELESYDAPLPLVVEVWSRSTGDFDVEVKLQEYQRRGHLEIWRLHPYERSLTGWRRQADGSYLEWTQTGGSVQPSGLPNVTIDLDALFIHSE